jgi:hypothetical protein
VKLSVVLSTSQTAVALDISGFDIGSLLYKSFPRRENGCDLGRDLLVFRGKSRFV